jgi:hypothetical protein
MKSGVADAGSWFALGDLVAGVARLLEATLAYFDRAQAQRRNSVGEKVTPQTVLRSAERAGRHLDAALSWLVTII